MLLISCKQYARAIEILTETEFYELTHYFLQFCLKNNLIEIKPNEEPDSSQSNEKTPLNETPRTKTAKKIRDVGGTQKHLSQYIHDKIENNYIRLIKSLE